MVPLLEKHPNLVVLRTFSKAMGMAGLRVGYLLAAPDLVREINKARLPYNLNFFSQAGGRWPRSTLRGAAPAPERETPGAPAGGARSSTLSEFRGCGVYPSPRTSCWSSCSRPIPRRVFEALYEKGSWCEM